MANIHRNILRENEYINLKEKHQTILIELAICRNMSIISLSILLRSDINGKRKRSNIT